MRKNKRKKNRELEKIFFKKKERIKRNRNKLKN